MIQPNDYVRSLLQRAPGETVTARGWVKTRRDSKNVHFVQLNDGSSTTDLQVVLEPGVVPPDVLARITTGACISVEGELIPAPFLNPSMTLLPMPAKKPPASFSAWVMPFFSPEMISPPTCNSH